MSLINAVSVFDLSDHAEYTTLSGLSADRRLSELVRVDGIDGSAEACLCQAGFTWPVSSSALWSRASCLNKECSDRLINQIQGGD